MNCCPIDTFWIAIVIRIVFWFQIAHSARYSSDYEFNSGYSFYILNNAEVPQLNHWYLKGPCIIISDTMRFGWIVVNQLDFRFPCLFSLHCQYSHKRNRNNSEDVVLHICCMKKPTMFSNHIPAQIVTWSSLQHGLCGKTSHESLAKYDGPDCTPVPQAFDYSK